MSTWLSQTAPAQGFVRSKPPRELCTSVYLWVRCRFTSPVDISELESKLEAAEQRIAFLTAAAASSSAHHDGPDAHTSNNAPDGEVGGTGHDEAADQLRAELAAVHRRVAELEDRAERAVELEGELSFVRRVCPDVPLFPGC